MLFRTLAFASTDGGITLSGPKACLGSMKEARILPHFLHSAGHRRVRLSDSAKRRGVAGSGSGQHGNPGDTNLHESDDGRGLLIPILKCRSGTPYSGLARVLKGEGV